jgi:hypothetical protein
MAIEDSTSEPPLAAATPSDPVTPAEVPLDVRKLTVSYQVSTMLRLQGRWLDRAGFRIGTKVRVSVFPGRFEIEAIEQHPTTDENRH